MSSKNENWQKVLKKKRSDEMVTKKPIFKVPRLEDAPSIQRKNMLSGYFTNWPIISSQYQPKPLIKPPRYTKISKRQEAMDDDSNSDEEEEFQKN